MQNEGATQGFRDDPLAEPVRWWRRSPANTSTLSKAVCVMAASFALTAVLGGTCPTHALAVDETGGQAAVASAAPGGADSVASAHGVRSVAVSATGSGTTATLSDASAYASGSGCAALQAADGASVTMTGGSLEATGGTALRAEGEGSSIRVSGAQVLSRASLAELAGDVTVELSGVESTSEHAPAVYVAAGVPTLRLTNGTVVHGSVVLAGEADIDIQTDSTSRLDGSIVRVA